MKILLMMLLSTLFIQFGTINPYNMLPNNSQEIGLQCIEEIKARINANYGGYWSSSYGWVSSVPNESIVVCKGEMLWGSYQNVYRVLVPMEAYNQQASSIACNAFTYSDNTVDSVTINFQNYIEFWVGSGNYVNNPYINGYKQLYFDDSSQYQLVYCWKPIYCNGDLVVFTDDSIQVPVYDSLGSLDANGHYSEVDNGGGVIPNIGGLSSHSTGASHPSGHSSSTHGTTTPDTNDALQQIIAGYGSRLLSNTNDLIENSYINNSILGGMAENLNKGIAYIFNMLSVINDKISYAISIPSKDEINEVIESCEMYDTYEDLKSTVSSMTSSMQNMGQTSDFVWTIPLPSSWGGTLTYSFNNYIDSTNLSLIRTIIGALMIISTIVFVIHQIPDIIGGGSGGENQ